MSKPEIWISFEFVTKPPHLNAQNSSILAIVLSFSLWWLWSHTVQWLSSYKILAVLKIQHENMMPCSASRALLYPIMFLLYLTSRASSPSCAISPSCVPSADTVVLCTRAWARVFLLEPKPFVALKRWTLELASRRLPSVIACLLIQ